MKDLERVIKAFANRRRLTIVEYLKRHKEAPVSEIAHEINLSMRATSKHLGILFSAEILEKEQRSLQIFYRLASQPKRAIRCLIDLV